MLLIHTYDRYIKVRALPSSQLARSSPAFHVLTDNGWSVGFAFAFAVAVL